MEGPAVGLRGLLQHPRATWQVPEHERQLGATEHLLPVHVHVQVPGPDVAMRLPIEPGLLRVTAVQQHRLDLRDLGSMGAHRRLADHRNLRLRVDRLHLHHGPAVQASQ